jgi:bifunctional DNA-binding transcriptional regulator/antitoxin component of YhaV-PrlF toxin-antitoxin module
MSKGERIVIPARIRALAEIEPGSGILVFLKESGLVLEAVSEKMVDRTRGMFKGGPSLSAALKRERRDDRPPKLSHSLS